MLLKIFQGRFWQDVGTCPVVLIVQAFSCLVWRLFWQQSEVDGQQQSLSSKHLRGNASENGKTAWRFIYTHSEYLAEEEF